MNARRACVHAALTYLVYEALTYVYEAFNMPLMHARRACVYAA